MEWMGWAVNHQIFEGLVKYELQPDGSMKTVPSIAESWSSNGDATVWTFKLKRGVTFSAPVDREVTADDFVKSLNYVTDPTTGPSCPTSSPQSRVLSRQDTRPTGSPG